MFKGSNIIWESMISPFPPLLKITPDSPFPLVLIPLKNILSPHWSTEKFVNFSQSTNRSEGFTKNSWNFSKNKMAHTNVYSIVRHTYTTIPQHSYSSFFFLNISFALDLHSQWSPGAVCSCLRNLHAFILYESKKYIYQARERGKLTRKGTRNNCHKE